MLDLQFNILLHLHPFTEILDFCLYSCTTISNFLPFPCGNQKFSVTLQSSLQDPSKTIINIKIYMYGVYHQLSGVEK